MWNALIGAVAVGGFAVSAMGGGCGSSCGSSTASAGHAGGYEAVRVSHHHGHGHSGGSTIVDIAAGSDQFSTLVAAVQAAGLADDLMGEGPFTVFAPTNAAFAKLPAGTVDTLLKPENRDQLIEILTFHVVPGELTADKVIRKREAGSLQGQRIDINVDRNRDGSLAGVRVNGADVVQTDIRASNGVIHVIDEVILPEQKNAVEVASAAGSFNTLIAAAKAAGLAGVLSTEGPLTILAPTDEAFAKLPAGTVESLLKPENRRQLQAILKYHVIEGRLFDDQVARVDSAETLEGREVAVDLVDGRLMIDNAKVIKSDIESSNAVIHVIDSVLIPQ